LLLALAVPAARAQQQTAIGVEITPIKFENDLTGRDVDGKVTLVNHEADPRRITVSVTGLGHDLDGSPEFLEHAAAAQQMHVNQTSFVLDPGASKDVAFTASIPANERSLYAAIIAEFAPLTPGAGQIEVHSRVASLFLLRGPKPWRQEVEVVDVGLIPGAPGQPVTVFAAAKDTGNVHIKPTGTVKIFKGSTLLTTTKLTAQTILPGFARRLTGTWTPDGPVTGKLTFDVTLFSPPVHIRKTIDFASGLTGRPAAEIQNLLAKDDGGPLVTMTIRNTASVPVAPSVVITAAQGKVERGRTVIVPKEILAGSSTVVEWRPELGDGAYLITAQLKAGDTLLDQAATTLRVGAAPAASPVRSSRALPIVLAVLLLLGGLGLFLVLWKRRARREEETPAPSLRSGVLREARTEQRAPLKGRAPKPRAGARK
jgi:hypothetical protein